MNIWDKTLYDQNAQMVSLDKYKGKWLVIYVYPKDDTPGCTKEACDFRDASADFVKEDVVFLGVSKDSHESHMNFAKKYKLGFPLLSDPELELIRELGAYANKNFMGNESIEVLRNTYVFSPSGELVKEYVGVNPLGHVDMVLSDVRLLKNRQ